MTVSTLYDQETAEETTRFNAANSREQTKLAAFFELIGATGVTYTDRQGYAAYDAQFYYGGRAFVVEAKVRNYPMARFQGHLYEQKKHRQLVQMAEIGWEVLFILFFEDGCILYNMSARMKAQAAGRADHQLDFEPRQMPAYTSKERGTVTKYMASLKVSKKFGDRVYESL